MLEIRPWLYRMISENRSAKAAALNYCSGEIEGKEDFWSAVTSVLGRASDLSRIMGRPREEE